MRLYSVVCFICFLDVVSDVILPVLHSAPFLLVKVPILQLVYYFGFMVPGTHFRRGRAPNVFVLLVHFLTLLI